MGRTRSSVAKETAPDSLRRCSATPVRLKACLLAPPSGMALGARSFTRAGAAVNAPLPSHHCIQLRQLPTKKWCLVPGPTL
eukprot:scaffold10540_cov116-Isochrysis_galbana.AAC.15